MPATMQKTTCDTTRTATRATTRTTSHLPKLLVLQSLCVEDDTARASWTLSRCHECGTCGHVPCSPRSKATRPGRPH
eukprot:6208920-Pleurochrysis_carterae.AAC.3